MNFYKYKRVLKGYTQIELAEKAGVTQHNISLYENNKAKPNAQTLLKLSQALEFDINEVERGK